MTLRKDDDFCCSRERNTMKKNRFYALDLQHFAGEGEGAAAQTGETGNSAAAGQNGAARGSKSEFEELIGGRFKSDFQKKTQAIIDSRFKNLKSLEAYKEKTDAILSKVGSRFGIEDFDAFLADDESAAEGSEEETADEAEETAAEDTPEGGFDGTAGSDGAHDDGLGIMSGLFSQENALRELYPGFDLRTELRGDPRFARLVSGGMDLRSAYEAIHHGELVRDAMAYTARAVRESTAKSLEARGGRPLENGLSAAGGTVTKTNVDALTAGDILKILKQVENGASISF